MANLLTPAEMALWTQTPQATLDADPFAVEVNEKLSAYILFLAGNTTWDAGTVPVDVKMLAIRAIRRTYVNPDSEVQSSVGPIGSRILDEAALAAALTEAEMTLLEGKREDGGPEGLWVRSATGGAGVDLPPTIYVDDNLQTNLGATPPWSIPYLDINDVAVQDSDFV